MFSVSFFTAYSEKGNCCMMEWALMISFDNGLCINIDIQDVNLNIFCTWYKNYSFEFAPELWHSSTPGNWCSCLVLWLVTWSVQTKCESFQNQNLLQQNLWFSLIPHHNRFHNTFHWMHIYLDKPFNRPSDVDVVLLRTRRAWKSSSDWRLLVREALAESCWYSTRQTRSTTLWKY